MIICKFGGASVKNSESIQKLPQIIHNIAGEQIIVVSAIGKTTNKLEEILALKMAGKPWEQSANSLIEEHLEIASGLFPANEKNKLVFSVIKSVFNTAFKILKDYSGNNYDFIYDQVVSAGELASTKIVSHFLLSKGLQNNWMDIRDFIETDSSFREAKVAESHTRKNVSKGFDFNTTNIFVTQGFIAADKKMNTTTLGREGSDYTAALLANMLNAEKVILWKDVDGIFNADPKLFPEAKLLKELSYREAIELSFYGAKIIHPKTIKPVQNKNIPIFVNNFNNPGAKGSKICKLNNYKPDFPVYIVKDKQMLISISPKDLSFILEEHISRFFTLLDTYHVKVNMMQNSAISFSVCCDKVEEIKLKALIETLKADFRTLYNSNLELITIRHYTKESITKMTEGKKTLMEQKSRNTAQFVVE
ncbi:MAG: aspartate kinase [Chlorobi bacterium]|nr:aspartate kinase [Chlorobiota bacterium]